MPQLCLGSLPDPGRTKKHQAMSIKVDKRAAEIGSCVAGQRGFEMI